MEVFSRNSAAFADFLEDYFANCVNKGNHSAAEDVVGRVEVVEEAFCVLLLEGQQNLMDFGEFWSVLNGFRQLNRDFICGKIVVYL